MKLINMNFYHAKRHYVLSTVAIGVVLLIASDHQIKAQDTTSGALEGVIVDTVTGAPIPKAIVQFTNELNGVPTARRTDSNGRFYQGLLPPGNYKIKISAPGYDAMELEQRVFATRTDTLRPLPVMLTPLGSQATCQTRGNLAVASVPNATITVEPLDGGQSYENTISKDHLLCIFDNLPPKTYRVTASLEGYQSAKTEVVVSVGKTSPLTLNILPTESFERIAAQAGRYYALIIGNNNYRHFPQLKTAVADAIEVNSILQVRYGFQTKLLLNANREQIIVALNGYRRHIEPNANLLIYYAGHGHNDKEVEEAYWLPIDARTEDPANWISAADITKNAKGIPARHILIVSDSCYSGTISRGIEVSVSEPVGRERYLQKMSGGKSRTLMASGGNEPVADGGGGGHSVFADALLTGLREMDRDIFAAEELYRNFIREVVSGKSNQTPEYNPIRDSGHESGDFVFIRKRAKSSASGI